MSSIRSLSWISHRDAKEQHNRRPQASSAPASLLQSISNALVSLENEECETTVNDEEKLKVSEEDLRYHVRKLKKEGIVTNEAAKQFIMLEKCKESTHLVESAKKDTKIGRRRTFPSCFVESAKKGTSFGKRQSVAFPSYFIESAKKVTDIVERQNITFPEDFLDEASRKAQSSPPLIRIDEWNGRNGNWHRHGIFTIDDEVKTVMNGRCQTKESTSTAVLNNSDLTLSLDFDKNEELFEETSPETKSSLEKSSARKFLLSISEPSDDGTIDSKQLIVAFDNNKRVKEKSNNLKYKDNDMSIRNIRAMRLPLKGFAGRKRLVCVKGIEFDYDFSMSTS